MVLEQWNASESTSLHPTGIANCVHSSNFGHKLLQLGGVCAQRVHNARLTGRTWGTLGQLAIFVPKQTMLPHQTPMFHPTLTPKATQGPKLQP